MSLKVKEKRWALRSMVDHKRVVHARDAVAHLGEEKGNDTFPAHIIPFAVAAGARRVARSSIPAVQRLLGIGGRLRGGNRLVGNQLLHTVENWNVEGTGTRSEVHRVEGGAGVETTLRRISLQCAAVRQGKIVLLGSTIHGERLLLHIEHGSVKFTLL